VRRVVRAPGETPPVPSPRHIRLLAAALAGAALFGSPSALAHDGLHDRKHQVDARIAALQSRVTQAKETEGVLSSEIAAASTEIDSLEGDITVLSERVATLEGELAALRARLARLESRFEEQTRDLEHLKRQLELAQRRLEERLVEIYESYEAGVIDILLQVESVSELIEQVDYVTEIGRQDRAIVNEIDRLKNEMRIARRETAAIKKEVAEATAVVAEKTAAQRAARDTLLARQSALSTAQAEKQQVLAGVKEDRRSAEQNLVDLEAASAALTAQIQAAQTNSGGTSGGSTGSGGSSGGLIWPVSGVVTSTYGPRWGSFHSGIDIAAPYGTPIRAAASGRVIIAGWSGGYGNLVVIDHGNGLATAYAHMSAIWVGGGSVSQGQGIGAVGCTGSCTGNHVHFEVRVNGSAVDPMGYL
jgi:murein DD-endopeptidase MepM/ murein hydrolase activator NlpD